MVTQLQELASNYLPNLVKYYDEFLVSIGETIYMTLVTGVISFIFGLFFGIVLTVTKKGGILQNRPVFWVLDKLTNLLRSIPFIILIGALIPLTRAVIGTSIGTKGAMLPLVIGTVPFFSRQIETAFSQLDGGLVEAAQSMGNSPLQIIRGVYLRESIPGILRAVSITLVSLIGLTAMAGVVGGGGIGDFAIRYGYRKNFYDITYLSVIVLLIMVTIVQGICNVGIKKNTH